MQQWIRGLLWALIITMGGAAFAADSGWKKEKVTREGIAVYSRNTPGTTIREVRAKFVIDAPPTVVLDAACDPDTFKETTRKYVELNKYYKAKDPNVWFNYQLVNYPVVSRRDYILRYEKIIDKEKGVYRLTWRVSGKLGPPPKEDVIRVTKVDGSIDISPNRKGRGSVVRYTLLADPGGNIPEWIINVANRTSLPNILREMRDASLKLKQTHPDTQVASARESK